MADRNMRSPLLRTPRASLSRSMLGRRSHLLLAWFRPSRVPPPNHSGPAISTPRFHASKKAWGAAAKCCSSRMIRSEEHTSELQSLMRISYAVFCLKKKKKQQHTHTYQTSSAEKKVTKVQHTTKSKY